MLDIRNQRGQSLVELTLMTPLILIALYIPVDFGIGLYTGHLTQNAVREAARIGVSTQDPFNSTAAGIVADEAVNRLPDLLAAPRTVTVNYYSGGAANCLINVEVRAQGRYNFFLYQLMRLFSFSVPDWIQITRATQMRYEFQPATNGTGSSAGVTNVCTGVTVTATRS